MPPFATQLFATQLFATQLFATQLQTNIVRDIMRLSTFFSGLLALKFLESLSHTQILDRNVK